jgi:hypothetical protein
MGWDGRVVAGEAVTLGVLTLAHVVAAVKTAKPHSDILTNTSK